MKKSIEELIAAVRGEVVAFRHELHRHPEPAYEEHRTSGAVAQRLERIPGMEVTTGIANTGVVGLLGSEKSGPCIALRADMDCLRMQERNTFAHASTSDGLMHACGHDGHTACLLGTAMVLSALGDELTGPVKFLFQPAEENHGGGGRMVEEGVLENPQVEAIYGLHGNTALEVGQIGLRAGPSMAASRYFTITVEGKGCHAASPHLGIDPVLIGSRIVTGVQSIISRNINPFDNCLISIPKFTGSTAPNVIPEKAILEGTLRALSNSSREILEQRLRELVQKTAEAHGGRGSIEYYAGYPLLVNHQEETAYVQRLASELLGAENVDCEYPPSLGAEDFAFYAEKVPAAFFWLGLQPRDSGPVPPLHHPGFDFNDEALPIGIRLMSEIAVRFGRRCSS